MSAGIRHMTRLARDARIRPLVGTGVLVCTVAMALGGCGSTSERALHVSLGALEAKAPPAPASSSGKAGNVACGDPTASLRPRGQQPAPGHMPTGTFMRTIQDRGRLIVGVDQNTLLFGYLNPFNGQIEGFDIDMLRVLAKAIFGDPNAIEFKAISSAQRIPVIQDESVDIVADAMTINCERARQVAFTTVYYDAGQRIMVPSNSPMRSTRDLAGRKVCATVGSTSIENIHKLVPRAIPYPVPLRTDCLVALQEGRADAISTDDAILYGFQAQDPYTKIVGPRFSNEPYGMAINKRHPEFVRFVNAVLERTRNDGTWASIYEKWLGRVTHAPAPVPPPPHYRD
jgi:polar amino acid transport system substrate-binding protein